MAFLRYGGGLLLTHQVSVRSAPIMPKIHMGSNIESVVAKSVKGWSSSVSCIAFDVIGREQAGAETRREKEVQTDRWHKTGRQADGRTDKQTHRQTDRQK